MKVNANQLRRIIKRETDKVLNEQSRRGSIYEPEYWWSGPDEHLDELQAIVRRVDDTWAPPNPQWPLIAFIMDLDHWQVPHDLLKAYEELNPGILERTIQLYVDNSNEIVAILDSEESEGDGDEIIAQRHEELQDALGRQGWEGVAEELRDAGHQVPGVEVTSVSIGGEEIRSQDDDEEVVVDREEEEEVAPVNEMINRHIKMLERKFSTKGRSRRRR